MRVQALDANASTPHPAAGLDEIVAHSSREASTCVVVVSSFKIIGTDERLEAMNSPLALETTHRIVQDGVNEPKERRHWCTVAQVRLIFDNDRATVRAANYNGEATSKRTSDELFHYERLGRGRLVKTQRQNSSVRRSLVKNPFDAWPIALVADTKGVTVAGSTSG
jgi:hypothetical protein